MSILLKKKQTTLKKAQNIKEIMEKYFFKIPENIL